MKGTFPVFCLELSGERGMNGGQDITNREKEFTVNDSEGGNTGQESGMKSEKQLKRRPERWRDEGDESLADDEEEEDDDDEQRRSSVFVPLVEITRKTVEKQTGCDDVRADDVRADDVITHQEKSKNQSIPQEHDRNSGVVMFPLLVWAGHELLPLDVPVVRSAPFRLVYTLRCALFATFPIILGVFVHGVSRLKFSSLNPLFEGKRVNRHTVVHMTYVQDSLRLFLLFFLQLAVVSTYVHQNTLKLIPLFTIVFVFGRLIYWPGVCFGSSVRVLGFSLSFLPVLALMGLNLYFVCSSSGQGAVFDVAPPTTPPPPKARWWG
ncbi:Transmembrane protein 79 [Bagarius yarrelli]|uniref:Transmembrane protein 79 n=1 Tax=Bagarius yarrelli TaxID=175774 RepID=A0A556VW24_BAGYA|nr:Transmembrane protein 79 [Bagarius yarrelli]